MAEKLEMMSSNIIQENIDYIASKFPNALKEVKENGKIVKKIDFDVLKQELSTIVIDDKQERYQMTWPDKKKSILLANSRINATLRPIKEKSVDFDNTQNLYIEGDNLDVLKLLRETYLGKVKVIYIDPPYNTGNDFIYEDDFSQSTSEYLENSGQYDFQGNRLVQNNDTNGRFHTDWLNMMYPRLKIARDLLREDGAIFISIDDNEFANMKKICDEIFDASNFIVNIIWQKKFSPQNDATYFSNMHDYILCYAKKKKNTKNDEGWNRILLKRDKMPSNYSNPDNDPRGPWTSGDFTAEGPTPNCIYEIVSPTGKVHLPPQGKRWVYNKENFQKLYDEKKFWFGKDGNSFPRIKRFWSEVQQGMVPNSMWFYEEVGHTQEGKQETNRLFGSSVFDYPKPVRLIKRILEISTEDKDIVLDFFSGSATTAHATILLNSERNENRKYIMVQIPEEIDVKSEAGKAGYKNICEIGEERIKRAGKQIKADVGVLGENLDIGFRVLKLDSSNMNDVFHNPNILNQNMLDQLVGNVKDDRTALDLLFQVMLELGIELSAKIEERELHSKKYFVVNENDIVACFDNGIDEILTKELAKIKPIYAVFKDSSFTTDSANINCEQIFKSISPSTTIKVI
jgi:adenine-specific DNA-methyltransferase